MTAYDAQALRDFGTSFLRGLGADADIAEEVSRHLVGANLAGHDSHGIVRLGQYEEQARAGQLDPAARPTVLARSPGSVLVDARRGFGQFSTMFATEQAIETARSIGVAVAVIRHSMHIGRLGEYADRISAAGQLGIVTVGMAGPGVGCMTVPDTGDRFFAANPWTFGVPGADRDVLVDVSTSTVAEGKVRVSRDGGAALPLGAVLDAEGRPTTDAEAFYAGGSIVPLGGEIAAHKGIGLAMAAAAFGAMGMIGDDDPTMAGGSSVADGAEDERAAGVMVIAIDPSVFGPVDEYRAMIGRVTDAYRATPTRSGATPLVPGDPERIARAAREAGGVDLPEATVTRLAGLARTYGSEAFPEPLA